MQEALKLAQAAYRKNEVPVGAVIVDTVQNKVVGSAYNQMEIGKDPTAHAEILAIRQACASLQTSRLEHCDLYVTLEPCPMCAQAVSFARIKRVYFGAYDEKGGGVEHGARIFAASSCHHRPEVYGGIDESEAKALLKNFFAILRKE